MSLCPITQDEIRRLKGYDRTFALRKYHDWLEKQRKEDKRHRDNQETRKYMFHYKLNDPERFKRVRKTVAERLRLRARKHFFCSYCYKKIVEMKGKNVYCSHYCYRLDWNRKLREKDRLRKFFNKIKGDKK